MDASFEACGIINGIANNQQSTVHDQLRTFFGSAGMPATNVFGRTSRMTNAPAAITDPEPTVTPPKILAPAQIQQPSPMLIARAVPGPARLAASPIE